MKLLSAFVGATKEDTYLQSSAHAIGIFMTDAAGLDYVNTQIKIDFFSRNRGTKPILPKMNLKDALTMDSFDEGFYIMELDNVKGVLKLSPDGALQLQEGEYIQVAFYGAKVTTSTTIVSIDAPVLSSRYRHLDAITINGQTKDINIGESSNLHLPISHIDTIDIRYPDKTVKYSSLELEMIARAINDLVSENLAGTAFVGGLDNYMSLAVDNAISVSVTPVDNNPFVLYTEKHSNF